MQKEKTLFKKSFWGGSKEEKVLNLISKHLNLLLLACKSFKHAFIASDVISMNNILDLEREGDFVRREIITLVYEGAFLAFVRPNLCQFVELVDEVIDEIKEAAQRYILGINLTPYITEECIKISNLNQEASEVLLLSFKSFCKGEDLREKNLAIRICEKRIDEIKIELLKNLLNLEITGNFWHNKILSDFLYSLANISDLIEDASDALQILSVSVR